jgi:cytochrome P450
MAFPTFTYALVAVAIWFLSIVVQQLLSPLRTIQGPFVARLTKLWYFHRVWRGEFRKDNIALHQKYGRVVRLAPNVYSFDDPDAIKVIYGKATEFDKSDWYAAWNAPGFTTLFSEPSVKVHGQLRRKFQHTYSMSSLVTYEGYVDKCIAVLKQRLEGLAKAGSSVDMAQWFLCYAADTVSMITYSKRMGFLETGDDVGGFLKDLHGNLFYNSVSGIYAEYHMLIFSVASWLNRHGIGKGTPRMSIGRFTADSIAEKRKQREAVAKSDSSEKMLDENAPRDFLSKFLDSNEEDPSRFTERDITVGLLGNVIAGSDTTAAAITATLYCLLKNPSTLAKLREEISSRVHDGELDSPPEFKQAQSMPYLQAVLQEAQRLYPGATLPLQRIVPEGGAELCGYFFPAGTVVGVNAVVLHKNKAIFGADAASFRPERWLESDKETLSYMQRHWMPFGLGSRTCIGKNISLLEMTKLIPELLRRFEFELEGELTKEDAEWEWIDHWLARPVSLPVKVRLRTEG